MFKHLAKDAGEGINPFSEMIISDMFVAESCSVSEMMSEGRPPAFFKSRMRIVAWRESDKGSLGVKTESNC